MLVLFLSCFRITYISRNGIAFQNITVSVFDTALIFIECRLKKFIFGQPTAYQVVLEAEMFSRSSVSVYTLCCRKS